MYQNMRYTLDRDIRYKSPLRRKWLNLRNWFSLCHFFITPLVVDVVGVCMVCRQLASRMPVVSGLGLRKCIRPVCGT
jgi:hypothetical protein